MPRPDRSSLVCNHRVALSGTRQRAAVATYRVEYVATRPGAVRELTEDDAEREDLRRRMGMATYMDRRPGAVSEGGTALFSQDGPVALAAARHGLEEAQGAVVCSVLSVRREEAETLGLTDKQSWERFVRESWPQAFAEMSGVPESRVRYVAAFHLNCESSYHVHILSYDAAGEFDSLLRKRPMERARAGLVDAALRPEFERASVERTLSRDDAVRAMRDADPVGLERGVELPETGQLSYAHLRRFHPETARQLRESVRSMASATPEVSEAMERHRTALERHAELKGLGEATSVAYVRDGMAELEGRLCNAALASLRPDRTAETPMPAAGREPVAEGPSTGRRRVAAVRQEVASCLGRDDRLRLAEAVASGRPMPRSALRKLPSYRRVAARTPELASGIPLCAAGVARQAATALSAGSVRDRDTGEEASRIVIRCLERALLRALREGARQAPPTLVRSVELAARLGSAVMGGM
jgi:hypothetical protein